MKNYFIEEEKNKLEELIYTDLQKNLYSMDYDIKEIYINSNKKLPYEIAELAWKRYDKNFNYNRYYLSQLFNWVKSDEGGYFWGEINAGNFRPFYDKYGRQPKFNIDNYSII